MNIREQIENDLEITLEGDFSSAVKLISPSGVTYNVVGQVLYDSLDENEVFSGKPVVSLRISSLSRVPLAGENWAVRIPENPNSSALTTYVLDKPPKHCRSIGFIKLYLTRTVQS